MLGPIESGHGETEPLERGEATFPPWICAGKANPQNMDKDV